MRWMLVIATAASLAAQNYEPPGKVVDVGGYRVHLNCQGSGTPAVMIVRRILVRLEPGAAGDCAGDESVHV